MSVCARVYSLADQTGREWRGAEVHSADIRFLHDVTEPERENHTGSSNRQNHLLEMATLPRENSGTSIATIRNDDSWQEQPPPPSPPIPVPCRAGDSLCTPDTANATPPCKSTLRCLGALVDSLLWPPGEHLYFSARFGLQRDCKRGRQLH